MPKPPRPSASEVLRHNLLILVGLPSLIQNILCGVLFLPAIPHYLPIAKSYSIYTVCMIMNAVDLFRLSCKKLERNQS